MTDAVTPTATSPDKPRRTRKAKAAPPPPKAKRAPVVRMVTAYLASQSEHHVEAADVLGGEFKRALRDELALDAKAAALRSRIESLQHDLQQTTAAWDACVPSRACRTRLDVLAKSIAHAKGLAADEPTEADLRGVEIP